jgi:uncharacterized protein YndB with AHSA1/START domain
MSFINFSANSRNSFGGEFLELVPDQRIRHTDRFEDLNLPGEMITTVELKAVFCGTELHVVQEGVPDMIPEGPAIWAGRSRCSCLPSWWSRPSLTEA